MKTNQKSKHSVTGSNHTKCNTENRSEYDKIRDYCEYTDRPFNARKVISETGMKKSSVYFWLKNLVKCGILTIVEITGPGTFYTKETDPEVTKQKKFKSYKEFFSSPTNRLAYYFGFASIAAIIAQCIGIAT
jgi:hypothetical protein